MPTTKPIVLLVDDDGNLLHALARSLRKEPYQILTARSGSEAIWILKTNDVDVVVTDEQMPGLSGSDLLAWASANTPNTMRIVLTGQASAAVAIRAINEGRAYHFFTKPCDPIQLAVAIHKALEHRSLIRENQRLLEASQAHLREAEQYKQDRTRVIRFLTEDLERPLEQTARHCRILAERYADAIDCDDKILLDSTADALGELRRMIDDMLHSTSLASSSPAPSPRGLSNVCEERDSRREDVQDYVDSNSRHRLSDV